MHGQFGLEVDYEVEDGLAKLREEPALVIGGNDGLKTLAPEQALEAINRKTEALLDNVQSTQW